jgi:hypothetical protein
MAVITGGKIIEGVFRGYQSAGAPSAGTSEIQTLTIGGTPTGGTFTLAFDGFQTAATRRSRRCPTSVPVA